MVAAEGCGSCGSDGGSINRCDGSSSDVQEEAVIVAADLEFLHLLQCFNSCLCTHPLHLVQSLSIELWRVMMSCVWYK